MNNLFNNFGSQNNTNNPQTQVLSIIENMKNSGAINQAQYNAIMQNQNNPQGILSVLLQNGLASNDQVANARNQASNFFGIK